MAAHGDRVPANVWQQDTTSGEWLLKIGKGSYKLFDPDPPPVPAAARWRKQRAHQRKVVYAQGGGKGEQPAGSAKGQTGKTSGGDQYGKKGASGKAGGKGTASKGRQYDGGGPRPKGGTSYEPKPKKPWVVCQVPNCPGHNGLRSFKYVIDIGRGANGLCCLGCGVEWAWSLQHQLAHGGIPGLDPVAVEDVPVPMEVQKVQGEGNAAGKRRAESPVGEDLTLEQAASAGNIKAAKARAAPKSSKPAGEMAIEIAKLRQKEAKLTEVKIPAGSAVPTAPSSNAASSSSSSSSTPPPASSGPSSAPGKQAGTEAKDASQQQLG